MFILGAGTVWLAHEKCWLQLLIFSSAGNCSASFFMHEYLAQLEPKISTNAHPVRVHRPKISTAGTKNSTSVFTALTTFRISVHPVLIQGWNCPHGWNCYSQSRNAEHLSCGSDIENRHWAFFAASFCMCILFVFIAENQINHVFPPRGVARGAGVLQTCKNSKRLQSSVKL